MGQAKRYTKPLLLVKTTLLTTDSPVRRRCSEEWWSETFSNIQSILQEDGESAEESKSSALSAASCEPARDCRMSDSFC